MSCVKHTAPTVRRPSGLSKESLWDCIGTFKELPSYAIKSTCKITRYDGGTFRQGWTVFLSVPYCGRFFICPLSPHTVPVMVERVLLSRKRFTRVEVTSTCLLMITVQRFLTPSILSGHSFHLKIKRFKKSHRSHVNELFKGPDLVKPFYIINVFGV